MLCRFVSVKISYQVFSRHEVSRLEEGNQRKETWTSHNTSSWPIQNYRQLSGPVFVYNDPTKLVTRPQAQTW